MIDEVLAVGDIAFQKKCLGKIGDVARAGRTVIFVSHNMAAIESLCSFCLMFRGGQLAAGGVPKDIIEQYIAKELGQDAGKRSLVEHPGRSGSSLPMMTLVRLFPKPGEPSGLMPIGSSLSIEVKFLAPQPLRPILGVTVKTAQGMPIFGVSNRWTHAGFDGPQLSEGIIRCDFANLPLMPGTYSVDLYFGDFADITRGRV